MIEDLICLQKENRRDRHMTKRDRKIHWHQSFVCEENGKKKKIETIEVENATNERRYEKKERQKKQTSYLDD